MVAEPEPQPLVDKVFSMAATSPSFSSSKKVRPAASAKGGGEAGGDGRVGILSFEVANAMSRAASLYRSLSDAEAARLLGPQCLGSHAVRALVPGDDARLLALALAEKLDALNRVAAVASRLGRRCAAPALAGFGHVYADLLAGRADAGALAAVASRSDAAPLMRRLDRVAAATAALYAELDALAELEQSARRPPTDQARRALEQRARWRRHDVRRLRDASLWNWTYDRAVLLLARAVCAIYGRIRLVFGDPVLGLDLLAMTGVGQSGQCEQIPQFSGLVAADSGPVLQSSHSDGRSAPICRVDHPDMSRPVSFQSSCGASPGKMFMHCLSLSSSAPWTDGLEDEFSEDSSCISSTIRSGMLAPFSSEQGVPTTTTTTPPPPNSGSIGRKARRFGPKSTVTSLAPASTVGGSALALHYANIVIVIEKLLRYPHLVGEEARDELYQMLPRSLKLALRRSLRARARSTAIYDAFLAHDWRGTLEKTTLAWLAPMAHNTVRWQAERSFEIEQQQQQRVVSEGSVLLLQTLYFADREKTEAAVCELLVGLNYICRYERQQNALLDCSSSLGLDDCVEWQVQ
ncbi:hypothetical protein Zm00014a_014231 [Zea mays]|uniref:DUF668 domain-containing protein n=1 Tax=Zea mays TaxID=4577 RepID=A0A3L6ETV5_MAIZE|nr:hypothetical protein Zm00014a_014231 [Zea mays]